MVEAVAEDLERRVARLEKRLAREKASRAAAEKLLEEKSLELYQNNQALEALNAELEARVAARTRDLELQRAAAERQAQTDQLTGIGNRRAFVERLEAELEGARASLERVSLLVVDLDKFKRVNDRHGHHAGDAVLVAVARRLEAATRDEDAVFRLGGDEFAVLARDREAGGAAGLAERLARAIGQSLDHGGVALGVGCSIGVAFWPDDAEDAGELQRCADAAAYAAKARNGGVVLFETTVLDRERCDRRRGRAIEQAVDANEEDIDFT